MVLNCYGKNSIDNRHLQYSSTPREQISDEYRSSTVQSFRFGRIKKLSKRKNGSVFMAFKVYFHKIELRSVFDSLIEAEMQF